MGWIYLAASADSQSPSKTTSAPSLIASETLTLKRSSSVACETDSYTSRPSGTTLQLSEVQTSLRLIFCSEDFPAKTSQPPELAKAWLESEADFISRSKDLSEKQNQLSYSLRTSLRYGHADLGVWSGDFPSSGMIVGGQLFQPQKLEPRTYVNDGSSLPTPTASDYGKNNGRRTVNERDRYSLTTLARHNLWPTPRTTGLDGGSNSRKAAKARGMWPTPKAADSNPCGAQSMLRYNERTGRKTLITEVAKEETGGQLNPTWVEWLMGFRLEWTALDALVTQWFRSKRKSRSSASSGSGVSA